jgi:hypothetical protein
MLMSQTIGALAAALAKAQGEFEPAVKDAANPFFKSNYCDLAGAIKATRDALSANGLAVVQAPTLGADGAVTLESMLLHSSGEFIGGLYPIRPVKNDPQGLGSALTYGRRYSFMALVGLAPEDDDGEAAQGRTEKHVASRIVRQAAGMPEDATESHEQTAGEFLVDGLPTLPQKANEGQLRLLAAAMKRFDIPKKTAVEIVKARAGVDSMRDIPAEKVPEVMEEFELTGAAIAAEVKAREMAEAKKEGEA